MERTAKHFRKRDAILSCLRHATEHPTAEWIHSHLKPEYPDISLGTVYRNLALFKEQGVIASLGTVKGVERFDGNAAPHAHFICTGCGSVVDLAGINVPEALSEAAATQSGGRIESGQLCFYGTCRVCQSAEKEEM